MIKGHLLMYCCLRNRRGLLQFFLEGAEVKACGPSYRCLYRYSKRMSFLTLGFSPSLPDGYLNCLLVIQYWDLGDKVMIKSSASQVRGSRRGSGCSAPCCDLAVNLRQFRVKHVSLSPRAPRVSLGNINELRFVMLVYYMERTLYLFFVFVFYDNK